MRRGFGAFVLLAALAGCRGAIAAWPVVPGRASFDGGPGDGGTASSPSAPDAGGPALPSPDGGAAAKVTQGPNPIPTENALPGAPDWTLGAVAGPGQLEGYAGEVSVEHGQPVDVHLRTDGNHTVGWELYRMGYYGGQGARSVASGGPVSVGRQPTPAADPVTGLVECAWPTSFTIPTDRSWVSGVYLVRLTRDDGLGSYVVFVVRDDERQGAAVFQSSVTTFQAYNDWGGENLYADSLGLPGGHAVKVSFDRPYGEGAGSGELLWWELDFIQWAESRGYDLKYATDVDLDRDPSLLSGQLLFLSVGHDEYWSTAQRRQVEAALAAGVSLGFFAGNEIYWHIRLEPSPVTGAPERTEVCYKDQVASDPLGKTSEATVAFRDPPLNDPENALMGVMFQTWELADFPWVVADASSWVFAGTGLKTGDALPAIAGYETDEITDNGEAPPGLVDLAHSPVIDHTGTPDFHDATLYAAPSGATVFAAGAIDWSFGLAAQGFADARMQRISANVLEHAGLVPTSAGADFGAGAPAAADLSRAASSVTTLAGAPFETGSADGPGPEARFNRPLGIAVDGAGEIFVADTGNQTLRLISPGGVPTVSTIAGTGSPGVSDGPGRQAMLYLPQGIAVASDGSLFVADTGNNRIVHVTRNPWTVKTFAGATDGTAGLADGSGSQARFYLPSALAFAGAELYVVDDGNQRIVRIDPDGFTSTVVGKSGMGMADGPGSTAQLYEPTGIAASPRALWIVDTGNREIRRVSLDGGYETTTVAGSYPGGFADGPASAALFDPLQGIAWAAGRIYVADTGNSRLRLLAEGVARTFAGSGVPGSADGSGATAQLSLPAGVAVLPDGSLVVVDEGDSTVRLVRQ
ncbi:MAG: N,N-dimethylformamidase beta subunit family domain-containing protein [Deltaproteobacteria bacterium]